MKKFYPLFFLFIWQQFNAQLNKKIQKNGVITGTVIDYKSKKKLHYVNIICKDKKQNIISGGISDKKGCFKITKLPLDSIFVDIQFIGYKSENKLIVLSKTSSKIDLKTIKLIEDNVQLDSVTVTIEDTTFEKKIDRLVINVGKDLASTGTNSLQLLENVPSVYVDYQTNTIQLRGNTNVRILVDGKPSNLSTTQLLKQIPSSLVKSVELISNPSAKYTPEGMSGIINLILKKNATQGFNGNLNLGVEHSINTRPSASFDFNYRINKINFYGNYGLDFGKFETFSNFNRVDKNLYQDIKFLDDSYIHYGKIGLDYYINKKNTLSIFTSQSLTNTDFYVNTDVFLNNTLIFDANNTSFFKTKEATYNLDYKLDLSDKGENLEFEINYTKNKDPQEDTITENLDPNNKEYNYHNTITDNGSILLVNLDYYKPMKNGNLEIGLESRVLKSFNTIITNQEIYANSTTIPAGNSELNYNREMYSAYLNLAQDYNKLSLKVGVRLEQFNLKGEFANTEQQNLENISDKIFSIYPSAFLNYALSEKNEMQLSYSRRVDRPSLEQITPIQEWASPLSISVGNRNLVPQFTNSFELNFTRTLESGYLSFGTFYRKTKNNIGKIINIDVANTDKQILSYTNYNSSESYGLEFSSRFKPFKWWTLRPSTNLYFRDNQGFINNNLTVANNTLFTARISNSFRASKKLRFSLSTMFRGNNENVLTKTDNYLIVNAAARYSIFKGNGTLTLRGTDIFDGYQLDFTTTNPFAQKGQFTLEYSSIYFGFSYSFGNGKNRERDRKYREENETEATMGVI